MAGHLEDAAQALNAAATQLPVELLQGVEQQLGTAAQYVQHAGGSMGEQFTGEIVSVQSDVQNTLGHIADLQARLQQAAQQVLSSGG